MIDWLKGLVGQAAGGVASVTAGVVARFVTLWNTIIGFWDRVKARVTSIRNTVLGWITAQISHALALLTTLKWIITTWVPRQLHALLGTVVTFVHGVAAAVAAAARAFTQAVYKALSGLVASVRNTLGALGRWATAKIGELWQDVIRLKDKVFGVLGSAERLAAWAAGAIASALLRWVIANTVRVGRALWAVRATWFLQSIRLIEHLLARII